MQAFKGQERKRELDFVMAEFFQETRDAEKENLYEEYEFGGDYEDWQAELDEMDEDRDWWTGEEWDDTFYPYESVYDREYERYAY